MALESIELKNISGLENIDLTNGYICDVETGICGPIKEQENNKKNRRGEIK